MSVITNLLILNVRERDVEGPLRKQLNAWCDEHAEGQHFAEIDTHGAGGSKVFCLPLLACCGNYFPWREFVAFFPTLPWEDWQRETVLLVVDACEEFDRPFAIGANGRMVDIPPPPMQRPEFKERTAADLASVEKVFGSDVAELIRKDGRR